MKKILPLTALLTLSLAHAADLPADLAARYESLKAATLKGDAAALPTFYAPDAVVYTVNGTQQPLAEALALDPNQMRYVAIDNKFLEVKVAEGSVAVRVEQTAKAEVNTGASFVPVEATTIGQDIWRKVNGQWVITDTRIIEATTRFAGQETRQVAPPILTDAQLASFRSVLGQAATPLRSLALNAPADDLAWLSDLTEGTRLIGAGEGSHGTAEHFQLKGRIFRELVEKYGYSVFLMEANLNDGLLVDAYVRGEGPDDANEATRNLDFAVWRTAEVRDLLAWMRQYNGARGDKPQLRVFGVDMQDARGTLTLIRSLTSDAAVLGALDGLKDIGSTRDYPEGTPETQARIKTELARLAELHRAVLALPADAPQREMLLYAVQTIRQQYTMLSAENARTPQDGVNVRDTWMASNTRYALDRLFTGQKAMLWAHNLHVAKRGYAAFVPQGQHLQSMLGNAYRTVGLSFAGGEIRAVDAQKPEAGFASLSVAAAPAASLDALLKGDAPAQALVFSRVTDPAVRQWLAQPTLLAFVGQDSVAGSSVHIPMNVAAAYDAVITVPRSTASTPLPPRQ